MHVSKDLNQRAAELQNRHDHGGHGKAQTRTASYLLPQPIPQEAASSSSPLPCDQPVHPDGDDGGHVRDRIDGGGRRRDRGGGAPPGAPARSKIHVPSTDPNTESRRVE